MPDFSLIRTMVIDIEVSVPDDGGFPSVSEAANPITAIGVHCAGEYVVFGLGVYTGQRAAEFRYVQCDSESYLIESFLRHYRSCDPDVITGWNVELFDVPYIINRIDRVLGPDVAATMSPWRILRNKRITAWGKEVETRFPVGIAILDYLQLYRKFVLQMQESYKLDYIAEKELETAKVDFSADYKSIDDMRARNHDLFIEYNLVDVQLIVQLDEKLQFIRQAATIAYDAKVNLNDVFGSVRLWDVLIHNYLLERNVAVPPMPERAQRDSIRGAFVKDPQCGRHLCVASFDLASLYPSLIRQYNISPDMFRGRLSRPPTVSQILAGSFDADAEVQNWYGRNCTVSAAGVVFSKEKQGFLSALMERMFEDRSKYKRAMITKKKKLEKLPPDTPSNERDKLKAEIQRLDAMQQAKKVGLNSAYGALGNVAYRWYQRELAESITLSGQVAIRWMERHLNSFLNKACGTTDVDFVIAIDTDSLYLNLERLVRMKHPDLESLPKTELIQLMDTLCEKVVAPQINKGYEQLAQRTHAFGQHMTMKREALADAAVWVGKKRYAINMYNHEGVQFVDPIVKMTGLDAVRSSTPKYIKTILHKAFEILLTGTEQQLQETIAAARDDFCRQPFARLAKASTANGLDKYRADPPLIAVPRCPIHVRGALVYNWWLDARGLGHLPRVREGDKIKFAYLNLPNPARSNVISIPSGDMPAELGLDDYVDRHLQFDKMIVEPIQHACDHMGWSATKRATLSSFFG